MRSILESTSGGLLGPPGPLLGGSCTSFGRLLDALEALLGALGGLLGCSWDALVRSWGTLGPVFGTSWCSWALSDRSGDARDGPKRPPRPFLERFWDRLGTI